MKKVVCKNLTLMFIFLIFLFLFSSQSFSEERLTFKASVDADKIGVEDYLQYSVVVEGEDLSQIPAPNVSAIKDFQIVGTNRSSSSQFQFVTGTAPKVISKITFTYSLTPRKKGFFTIPSATITFQGKTYSTSPIKVEVVDGSIRQRTAQSRRRIFDDPFSVQDPFEQFFNRTDRRPIDKDDIFIEIIPSKRTSYVGEQVILNTYLFTTVQVVNGQKTAGSSAVDGVWVEDVKVDPNETTEIVKNGKKYLRILVERKVIFPTRAGEITIPKAAFRLTAVRRDFGVRMDRQSIELETKPVRIKAVSPPQSGRPADFSGVVGNVSINAAMDKTETAVGEAVNLTLVYKGKGNLRGLSAPYIKGLADFTVYKPELEENYYYRGGAWYSEKKWKYILIPKVETRTTIGPFSFTFFNPVKKRYITNKTRSFVLNVSGQSAAAPDLSLPRVETIKGRTDINYQKHLDGDLKDESKVLLQSSFIWFVLLLPLFANAVIFAVNFAQSKREVNVVKYRSRNAQASALKLLRDTAKRLRNGSEDKFYESLIKSFANYLADKWNLASSGLTIEQIRRRLEPVQKEIAERVITFLEECEYNQFSGSRNAGSEKMLSMLETARDLIEKLEKILKP